MYCSSCGGKVAQGLNYCNFCGAKLNETAGESLVKTTELRAESLIISAMVAGFVLGLVAISVLMGVMKAVLRLEDGLIVAFTLLSFLILIVIEGVLIKRLFHRKRGDEARDDSSQLKGLATRELDAGQARGLPEAMPSVTEESTRTFEPVYSERKTK